MPLLAALDLRQPRRVVQNRVADPPEHATALAGRHSSPGGVAKHDPPRAPPARRRPRRHARRAPKACRYSGSSDSRPFAGRRRHAVAVDVALVARKTSIRHVEAPECAERFRRHLTAFRAAQHHSIVMCLVNVHGPARRDARPIVSRSIVLREHGASAYYGNEIIATARRGNRTWGRVEAWRGSRSRPFHS